MTIHDRLREWRESKGWTQEQLAGMLDTSLQSYSRYERGLRTPKGAHFKRLAELGCDPTWLITGTSSTSQAQSQSMPAVPSLDAGEITLNEGEGRALERPAAEPEPEPAPEGAWAPRADVGPIVRISIAVEGVYRDLGIPVAAHEITRIAVEKYNELLDVVEDAEDWPVAIRIMANGLRKELLAAPSATSSTKQRA